MVQGECDHQDVPHTEFTTALISVFNLSNAKRNVKYSEWKEEVISFTIMCWFLIWEGDQARIKIILGSGPNNFGGL